jgi:hypothetical protein
MIDAPTWNRTVGPVRGNRWRAGTRVNVVRTPVGQCLTLAPKKEWRHPWFTQAVWVGSESKWVATVQPGFVNGICPVYRQAFLSLAQSQANGFGINPLSGEFYFSSPIFNKSTGQVAAQTEIFNVPLYAQPAMELGFRNVGFDGPGSVVPDFFKRLGVQDAPKGLEEDLLNGTLDLSKQAPQRGNRLLRACDIVLHQPRTALTSTWTLGELGQVTQELGMRSALPSERLKIYTTPEFRDGSLATGIDPAARFFEEATWDETLVSTVFLVSPPDTEPYSEPDVTWQPFVRHSLFWNLLYAQPGLEPVASSNVQFLPPLPGVSGLLIGSYVAASLNDLSQQAWNAILAHSLSGSFWTVTAGGSTAEFPEAVSANGNDGSKGIDGLNKDARLAAERLAAQMAIRAARLDPVFPYKARRFDISLLAA